MSYGGQADQSKPFLFSINLGEFLRGTSTLFISIALMFSFLEFFDMKMESNTIVFTMLMSAVVINILLEINSKVLFAIVGFLTLSSVVGQLIVTVNSLLSVKHLRPTSLSDTTLIITCGCIMFLVATLLTIQLSCSAALFKLSGLFESPEPPKPVQSSTPTKKSDEQCKNKTKKSKKTVESVESACKTTSSSKSNEHSCSESQMTTQ